MNNETRLCIDVGSVNCPCQLSSCDECLTCSRLAGKDYCDCNWQGTCIYSEYLQNGSRPVKQRKSEKFKIQKKIWYGKDLAVMRISVPRGFAEAASVPGSYVFVRAAGMPEYFDTPISIMRSDYECQMIDIAVRAEGPKSRKLLDADKYVEMRGVYRNGLVGVAKLMRPGRKKVLCMTKGVGLAPVANYIRWANGSDEIDVVADLTKVNRFFAEDCLAGCAVNSLKYHKLPIDDLTGFKEYDLVILAASEYFQENMPVPTDKLILSNNFKMCCGEGICGACIYTDAEGNSFHMCKCREKKAI